MKKAWLFPFLYAFSSFLVIFLFTLGFRVSQKYAQNQVYSAFKLVKPDNNNNDESNDDDVDGQKRKDNFLDKEMTIYNPVVKDNQQGLLNNTCEIIMVSRLIHLKFN